MQEKSGERSQSRLSWPFQVFSIISTVEKPLFQKDSDPLSHFQLDSRLEGQWKPSIPVVRVDVSHRNHSSSGSRSIYFPHGNSEFCVVSDVNQDGIGAVISSFHLDARKEEKVDASDGRSEEAGAVIETMVDVFSDVSVTDVRLLCTEVVISLGVESGNNRLMYRSFKNVKWIHSKLIEIVVLTITFSFVVFLGPVESIVLAIRADICWSEIN